MDKIEQMDTINTIIAATPILLAIIGLTYNFILSRKNVAALVRMRLSDGHSNKDVGKIEYDSSSVFVVVVICASAALLIITLYFGTHFATQNRHEMDKLQHQQIEILMDAKD